jgi:hypothetical protein
VSVRSELCAKEIDLCTVNIVIASFQRGVARFFCVCLYVSEAEGDQVLRHKVIFFAHNYGLISIVGTVSFTGVILPPLRS